MTYRTLEQILVEMDRAEQLDFCNNNFEPGFVHTEELNDRYDDDDLLDDPEEIDIDDDYGDDFE